VEEPLAGGNASDEPDLTAGDFSSWLSQMQSALRGEGGSDVPCGDCTACCTSSQFVHIEPDETDTLSHIPPELLFPAPRFPRGHLLLGYDERGHCPMLIDNQCSIYEHRPRTCRIYDCRVFPAAGVGLDDAGESDERVLIVRQARRWRFGFTTPTDRREFDAVRAAATFLREQPDRAAPANATELAVRAIEVHHEFLDIDAQK
jgi:Fe-S-cluster containining protein